MLVGSWILLGRVRLPMRVSAPLGVRPARVKVPGVLIVSCSPPRPDVVEPKMMFPVEMLPAAVRAIAPPVPAELELISEVLMLPEALRAIAPPLPVLELAFREPAVVSIAPLRLVRAITPPLPLPAALELILEVLMLPEADRAISPPEELVSSVPALLIPPPLDPLFSTKIFPARMLPRVISPLLLLVRPAPVFRVMVVVPVPELSVTPGATLMMA